MLEENTTLEIVYLNLSCYYSIFLNELFIGNAFTFNAASSISNFIAKNGTYKIDQNYKYGVETLILDLNCKFIK